MWSTICPCAMFVRVDYPRVRGLEMEIWWDKTGDYMSTPRTRKQYSSSILAPPVDTSDRLGKMSQFYHREAERRASNRANFAACILAAGALEAMLLSMCYVEDRQVRSTAIYKQKKFKF